MELHPADPNKILRRKFLNKNCFIKVVCLIKYSK